MNKLALILLTLGSATALVAQTTPETSERGPRGGGRGHGGPGRGHHGHPIVRVMDTDKNGELSAAEIANSPITLRGLDTDADGSVATDELHPYRPAGADRPVRPAPPADAPVRTRPMDPVMFALDANSDGDLSAPEIANAAASLNALDTNKDGKLTRDELRPLPPTE